MMGKFVLKRQHVSHIKAAHSRRIGETKAKMKLLVFSIVFAFLQVSHQNPTSTWTMMPHILVVEVDGTRGQQPLSCLEQPEEFVGNEDEDIFWRKNGVEEEQRGNVYLVELEESLGGGNYTCHSKDGSLLNHTEVLIQEDKAIRRVLVKTNREDYLKCSAQNYNGEFSCSWTWHSRRVGKVAFIKARRVDDGNDAQCSVDESSQRWTCSNFSCSVDNSGHGIVCLDKQYCPFAEESQKIHVTVYVRTEYFLVENYSEYFYLSEIVKPDKVRISKVNTTMIEWSYPSSWSSPYSYFPLTFEILQLKGRCKRCGDPCTSSKATKTLTVHSTDICQFEIKHKTKAVCVRAKDALCKSQWSEWSHIRLRMHRKNKEHNKN